LSGGLDKKASEQSTLRLIAKLIYHHYQLAILLVIIIIIIVQGD